MIRSVVKRLENFARFLEIAFKTKSLRTLCESESVATAQFGEETATEFYSRLADIDAAESPEDLIAATLVELPGRIPTFSLDFGSSYEIVFRANHPRAAPDGAIDISDIHRVQILSVNKKSGNSNE